MRAGLANGMIKQSGNTFTLDGEKIGVGTETAKLFLKERPEAIEKIKQKVAENI